MCVCFRTPLHCAASCNNVQVCKFLVESGAAVFAMTYSDMQTAADKCEEMEEGYTQCSQFLYGELRLLLISVLPYKDKHYMCTNSVIISSGLNHSKMLHNQTPSLPFTCTFIILVIL